MKTVLHLDSDQSRQLETGDVLAFWRWAPRRRRKGLVVVLSPCATRNCSCTTVFGQMFYCDDKTEWVSRGDGEIVFRPKERRGRSLPMKTTSAGGFRLDYASGDLHADADADDHAVAWFLNELDCDVFDAIAFHHLALTTDDDPASSEHRHALTRIVNLCRWRWAG